MSTSGRAASITFFNCPFLCLISKGKDILTDYFFDKLLDKAKLISRKDECVYMVFTVQDDPGFATFKSFLGDKMITFEVNASMHFFSVKKQVYVDQKIPLIGYFIISKDNSCKDIY